MPIIKGEGSKAEAPADSVFYLSSEVLGGRPVEAGDTIMLKIAEIGDGEIGVVYGEEEEVAPDGEETEDAVGLEAFGEKPMRKSTY